MTNKVVVSADATTQIKHSIVESGDQMMIHTQQDVTDIVEANKQEYALQEKHTKWGEMTRVASIPLSIYYSPEFQKISRDPVALKKWLNDDANLVFRTRPGKV